MTDHIAQAKLELDDTIAFQLDRLAKATSTLIDAQSLNNADGDVFKVIDLVRQAAGPIKQAYSERQNIGL